MGIGNDKTWGDKGTNFNFQLRNLQLLSAISTAVSGIVPSPPPVGGFSTEATSLSILSAIQSGRDFEQNLVVDEGTVGFPTYMEIRIWNGTGFNAPIYYNAAGAVVVPVGPLKYVNPQFVLDNILTQVSAINADLDVNLSTRASELTVALVKTNTDRLDVLLSTRSSEATLLATNVLLTAMSGKLDVNLSTRASEATLLLTNTALGTLNVTAAAQAQEATQLLVLARLVAISTNIDVALSTRASELTLQASNTLLTAIEFDTSKLDVLLSTRASEITLAAVNVAATALNTPVTGLTSTLTRVIVAGLSAVAAGARRASIFNAGATNATVLGATLKPGEVVSYSADGLRDKLGAISYDALTSELLISTVS